MSNNKSKANATSIKKGEVRNPRGRPKGSKDKATTELRQMITNLVEREFENVDALIHQLEPRERAKFITDLLKYAVPALSSTTVDATVEGTVTTIKVEYSKKEE